jgi:hypothetical protein
MEISSDFSAISRKGLRPCRNLPKYEKNGSLAAQGFHRKNRECKICVPGGKKQGLQKRPAAAEQKFGL